MSTEMERDSFIASLFIDYADFLKKECLHYVHYDSRYVSLVDDCIQETFIKAIMNYGKLRVHPNVAGWLVQCCKNYIRSDMRKQRNRTEIMNASAKADGVVMQGKEMNAFDRWLKREDALDTVALIYELLSPKERTIFQDYFIQDLSAAETAEKNHLSTSSVQAGVRRIREKIRRILHSILFISASQYILALFTHYIDEGR